jgi:hypothetical protein
MTDEEKTKIQEEIGWRKIVVHDLKANRDLIKCNQAAIIFLLIMFPVTWSMVWIAIKIWG